jgi:hypothetical protein
MPSAHAFLAPDTLSHLTNDGMSKRRKSSGDLNTDVKVLEGREESERVSNRFNTAQSFFGSKTTALIVRIRQGSVLREKVARVYLHTSTTSSGPQRERSFTPERANRPFPLPVHSPREGKS